VGMDTTRRNRSGRIAVVGRRNMLRYRRSFSRRADSKSDLVSFQSELAALKPKIDALLAKTGDEEYQTFLALRGVPKRSIKGDGPDWDRAKRDETARPEERRSRGGHLTTTKNSDSGRTSRTSKARSGQDSSSGVGVWSRPSVGSRRQWS
jgi:hypothetical protein